MDFRCILLFIIFGINPSNIIPVQGAKILSVFPYPGPSQYIFISPLLKSLAERGHEVTSISTFPQKEPVKNFRDIAVMESAHVLDDIMLAIAEGKMKSFFQQFVTLVQAGKVLVTNILENPEVKEIMARDHFDLIIVELLMSEALLGWGEYFNAPIVAVSTYSTATFLDSLVANPSPLSYIPHISLTYGNLMTLWQRIVNVLMHALDSIVWHYWVMPHQEQLYGTYFPHANKTLDAARNSVSLVLLNDHFSLSFARPYVPNMIEVGGLHIKQEPYSLPQELQTLLDNATEGAIYFSMGSNIKSKNLPTDKLKMILDTFRELPIQVLWKFESGQLPNVPQNVLIRDWYPQAAVLAHANVRLFITHGGYLSTTETIFFGKPILGIPMFCDQFMNVKNAVKAGYALSLDMEGLTKESLKAAILELWTNPKYTQTIQRKSKQYRDQPMSPLATAIYWVEYVLRQEGALHMRNAGQNLNFLEYYNVDAYFILFVGFFGMVAVNVALTVAIKNCIRNRFKDKFKIKSY